MDIRLIKLFNVALCEEPLVDSISLNTIAIKAGYIVPIQLCNQSTLEFVYATKVNYNSTFYKCWDQIERANETTLLVDQLLHYASTYGTNYESPFIYTRNSEPVEIPYSEYKIIKPITEEGLFERCMSLITSNIAMSSDTIDPVCKYIIDYIKRTGDCISIDKICNKEAQAIICAELDQYPTQDAFALLRCLVYNCTQSSMLIKDRMTINLIKYKSDLVDFKKLDESQLKLLSTIFYRFKPIFLAFKNENNSSVINKIRKLAKTNHKPFNVGFWESVLSRTDYNVVKEVSDRLDELTNFKLVQLIQAIRERLLSTNMYAPAMYKIRNGKMWLQESSQPMMSNRIYCWETMMELFVERLIENLKKKACTVKFPEDLVLTCPSSEKNFIGSIPFGSYFNMNDRNYVGIYWKNEWGTRDFDLSAVDKTGAKVGWNASYKNEGLVYSGDMTDADPEAAEILQCNKNCEDSIIFVNRYNGDNGSNFELMYGLSDQDIKRGDVNYMVNPDYIKLREKLTSNSMQQMVGAILGNKMYMMDIKFGEARVSGYNKTTIDKIIQSLKRKVMCYMDLKTLLLAAGFKERKRDTKSNPIQLDLTNLNKDTLINLFS